MNIFVNIQEFVCVLCNMICIGFVVEINFKVGCCCVQIGGMCIDWFQWLIYCVGCLCIWWVFFVGEQVLILVVGGEFDMVFVLLGIYFGDNFVLFVLVDVLYICFFDGVVIEYEFEISVFMVSGIKMVSVMVFDFVIVMVLVVMVKVLICVILDILEVVCINRLIIGMLEVQKGGMMCGNIEYIGGEFLLNGKVLYIYKYFGDSGGIIGSFL